MLSSAPKLAVKELTTLDQCVESNQRTSWKEWCKSLHSCHSCATHPECRWDKDKISRCREASRGRSHRQSGRNRQQAVPVQEDSGRSGDDEADDPDADDANLTEEPDSKFPNGFPLSP